MWNTACLTAGMCSAVVFAHGLFHFLVAVL
jgi:hypothetical protein